MFRGEIAHAGPETPDRRKGPGLGAFPAAPGPGLEQRVDAVPYEVGHRPVLRGGEFPQFRSLGFCQKYLSANHDYIITQCFSVMM